MYLMDISGLLNQIKVFTYHPPTCKIEKDSVVKFVCNFELIFPLITVFNVAGNFTLEWKNFNFEAGLCFVHLASSKQFCTPTFAVIKGSSKGTDLPLLAIPFIGFGFSIYFQMSFSYDPKFVALTPQVVCSFLTYPLMVLEYNGGGFDNEQKQIVLPKSQNFRIVDNVGKLIKYVGYVQNIREKIVAAESMVSTAVDNLAPKEVADGYNGLMGQYFKSRERQGTT